MEAFDSLAKDFLIELETLSQVRIGSSQNKSEYLHEKFLRINEFNCELSCEKNDKNFFVIL